MPDDPKSTAGHIRVGIGGWVYPPWRGTFYPPRLPQSQELAHASRHLTAIEINGTFYNSGKPDSFRKWRDETPEDFAFSLKGPRFVTHRSELASAGDALGLFFSRGVLELGDKLGAILWQFAPTKQFDATDFGAFLSCCRRIRATARSGMSSRRGTAVSQNLPLPSCCGSTRSPWRGSTTPNFRRSRKSLPILSICGCGAASRRSRPGIRPKRSTNGPSGREAGRPTAATCFSTSSTAPRCAPLRRRRR